MKKKVFCILLSLIVFIIFLEVNASKISNSTIKKIVSIVYDDSGSMSNNENWAYASYSLQNLVALMNTNDELGVTKMSNPNKTVEFDLTNDESRENEINLIQNWNASSNTPFSAVETAVKWLKNKKEVYNDTKNVEFWLIIITDGSFGSGYPLDMNDYLTEINTFMGNSKYEGILVAIGNDIPEYVKKDWLSIMGNHLFTSSNSIDIINAMSEVTGLVLGQGGKASNLNIEQNNKQIMFESSFPLKKFIVYTQDQEIDIKNVIANEANVRVVSNFTSIKPGSLAIKSRTFHLENNESNFIPAGKITVEFDSKVDILSNKFKILTEAAVNADLKVFDKTEKEIDDLNSYLFLEGEKVILKVDILSSVDNSQIDLKKFANEMDVELVINNEVLKMQYDINDNNFYVPYEIKSENTIFYSTVTLPGYFRVKSDVMSIDTKKIINDANINISEKIIEVPYKYVSDYEEIALLTYEVTGGVINDILNFEFKNLPKGITVSVNDVFADENGKLAVKIYNDTPADVKIYRNSEYKEIENSKITVEVNSSHYQLNWVEDSIKEIILTPINRKITTEILKLEENNLIKLNELNNTPIYIISVLANSEYLTKEELETLSLEYMKTNGISFNHEVVEYNGRYALKISCTRTLPQIFVKVGEFANDITLVTKYKEKSDVTSISIQIKDNITKYISFILSVLIFILLIGYLPGVKKRLNSKKYCIKRNNEFESIHVKLITKLIPYIREKGFGSDLTLIATENKNKVKIVNNFYNSKKILINNELVENGIKTIDLFIGDELKVVEDNRNDTYSYISLANDSANVDFNDTESFDDMFTDSKKDKKKASVRKSNDDFFG